jgi:hypothetical protein
MARRSRPRSTAFGRSASMSFAACGVRRSAHLRPRASPRISSPGFFAGTSAGVGGLDSQTARHLASLDGAIGQKQIAQGASSPAPYWCANTRASSTPSQSLRMALSGARPPMPASPPSRGPSPGRTGMDRASLASGSTRRRQCRRTEPMRRLHLPIGERLSRRPAASPAGGRQRSAKWERHSGASLA